MAKGTAFEDVLVALAAIGAIVALIAVGVGLSAKRHVTFYRDQSKRDKLLDVLQDRKWQPITATYTVRDRAGRTLALLWKNYLYNRSEEHTSELQSQSNLVCRLLLEK